MCRLIKKIFIKRVVLKKNKLGFFLFIDRRLFLTQPFLKSNNIMISDVIYTFFYVSKILGRFGLVSPINRLQGYRKK
jgi:hypothetical protein